MSQGRVFSGRERHWKHFSLSQSPFDEQACKLFENIEGGFKYGVLETNNLVLRNGLCEGNIAFGNKFPGAFLIEGKYAATVLFNYRPIKKGDQLGFNYGTGYWLLSRKCLPLLFDTNGKVIPMEQYAYKRFHLQSCCPRKRVSRST